MVINNNINKRKNILTPEKFGAYAYMKPLDGRLIGDVQFPLITYTPLGDGTTRITSSIENTFTNEDLGKRFCGLFNHLNPAVPNYDRVDEYFPAIVSSRYSNVIEIEDSENIIVDFNYNGGNIETPQIQTNGKGYIFFDNSDAFINTFSESFNLSSKATILVLKEFYIKENFVTTCYVVPEMNRNMVKNTTFTITSKSNIPARIKVGVEDLYTLENLFGTTIYRQHNWLFTNRGMSEYNFIVNNVNIVPVHRSIPHCRTYSVGLYEGLVSPNARRVGTTAFFNLNNYIEQKEISDGYGITEENFYIKPTSSDRGGIPTGENELDSDIDKFHYLYFNNFDFRGADSASTINTNHQGGGTYLVLDKGFCDYNPQTKYSTPLEEIMVKVSNDKEGLPSIFNNNHFSNDVLEIHGNGNFLKTAVNFSNRNTYLIVKRDGTDLNPFCFLLESIDMNLFNNYYTWCYFPRNERPIWASNIPNLSAKKNNVLFEIPRVGNVYTVSRDYSVDKTDDQIRAGEIPNPTYNNEFIRTAICWSTILGKGAVDIDPSTEIPVNSKPLELQVGDQFKIVGDETEKIYTVIHKRTGVYPSWGVEFVYRQPHQTGTKGGYTFKYLRIACDSLFPEDLEPTFEIEIVTSTSEILLDGVPREAFHVYMGNRSINITESTNYYNNTIRDGEGLGHVAYTQAEVGKFFREVDFNNSFWRENSGTYTYTPFTINDVSVKPLRYYNKGITIINCNRFLTGQFAGNSATRNSFEHQRLIYESLGENYKPEYADRDMIPFPPKYRVYNTNNPTNISSQSNPEYSTEVYSNDENAPDLPKPILKILSRLKKAIK